MFVIEVTDPRSPAALRLIAASEVELSALYPPEERFALSPEELVDQAVRFFVARDDGDASIGCCGYARQKGYGEVKRLFVAADHRGRGVANALLAHVEKAAVAEGLLLMRLETGRDSPHAIALYTRAGYLHRACFGDYPQNGSSVFMEKHLDQA